MGCAVQGEVAAVGLAAVRSQRDAGPAVCSMHGARAPQVREAALRRLALADAVHAADPRSFGEILLGCGTTRCRGSAVTFPHPQR
jgi:hypothetical protein